MSPYVSIKLHLDIFSGCDCNDSDFEENFLLYQKF